MWVVPSTFLYGNLANSNRRCRLRPFRLNKHTTRKLAYITSDVVLWPKGTNRIRWRISPMSLSLLRCTFLHYTGGFLSYAGRFLSYAADFSPTLGQVHHAWTPCSFWARCLGIAKRLLYWSVALTNNSSSFQPSYKSSTEAGSFQMVLKYMGWGGGRCLP